MTYESFLRNLNARGLFRIRPNLDRVQKVLRALGNPQDQWPAIHIAGTNGKGSVAAALESALRASGYRTGLYTSPHLRDLRERIQIDGSPYVHGFSAVADDVLAAEKRARSPLTYFELLTAMAFRAFAKMNVDIGIVECGMGGLWDATNVLRSPLASVITSVGLDHTEWLGRDEYSIAAQKAGIIKPGGYAISGVRGPGKEAIARAAREQKAELHQIDSDFNAEPLTISWRSGRQILRFHYKTEPPVTVPFGLLGSHQADNCALVMAALRRLKQAGWSIPVGKRDQALRDVHWPGRLQLIRHPQSVPVLLDGAHNPPAMNQLLRTLECTTFKNAPKTFVFSAFKDKDYLTMGRMITRLAAEVCLCPLPPPRGASILKLRSAFAGFRGPIRLFKSPRQALRQALRDTRIDGLVVVTGSLALVGNILKVVTPSLKGMGRRNDGKRILAHA